VVFRTLLFRYVISRSEQLLSKTPFLNMRISLVYIEIGEKEDVGGGHDDSPLGNEKKGKRCPMGTEGDYNPNNAARGGGLGIVRKRRRRLTILDLLMRLFVLTLFLGAHGGPGRGQCVIWRTGVLHGQTSNTSWATPTNAPTGTGSVH
jgi:hypothetical protein